IPSHATVATPQGVSQMLCPVRPGLLESWATSPASEFRTERAWNGRGFPPSAGWTYRLIRVLADDQRDVLAAEPEAVAQYMPDPLLAGHIRNVIEVAFGVGNLVVDSGRQDAL